MQLEFSHVDIVVKDLDSAVQYYRKVFGCTASPKQVWDRGGFHVEYVIMFSGQERFYLVQPIAGNLVDLMEQKGEGTIYRLCYTVPSIVEAYRELKAAGVQPENERGEPLDEGELTAAGGKRIVWLPKAIGDLSIELLDGPDLNTRLEALRRAAT